MDRNEFMELVYETFVDEPDNVLANGIIEAADAYVEHEKAQLSKEGTTKDTISRQAALDIFDDYNVSVENGELEAYSRDRKRMCELPPVQPEPHEGHWIRHKTPDGGEQYECSRCGVLWEFNDGTPEDNEAYFCPKCGTKMKGVRHESY